MINSGLIKFWLNQFNLKKFKRIIDHVQLILHQQFEELNLVQLFYAFRAYIYGILISLTLFVSEHFAIIIGNMFKLIC